jgi:hypothetical protein
VRDQEFEGRRGKRLQASLKFVNDVIRQGGDNGGPPAGRGLIGGGEEATAKGWGKRSFQESTTESFGGTAVVCDGDNVQEGDIKLFVKGR